MSSQNTSGSSGDENENNGNENTASYVKEMLDFSKNTTANSDQQMETSTPGPELTVDKNVDQSTQTIR